MKQELRDILNKIDDVLVGDREIAQQLWDVLSALRGPDAKGAFSKLATTAVIRREAFPKAASKSDCNGGVVCASMAPDSVELAKRRHELDSLIYPPDHFVYHSKSAFYALDLNWLVSNDESDKRQVQQSAERARQVIAENSSI